MARKGKEIDLGGVRIQVDPLVLFTRVMMRQKLLLSIVALIGMVATIAVYKTTTKRYTSRSNILIRYENFEDLYLQKLLNVGVGYLGADLEMMLIINELDLYDKMRKSMPYDMALRQIRTELGIRNQPRNIEIFFTSTQPVQAQRVAAFVTERLLGKMAELNEAPFNRELEALEKTLADLEPKKRAADNRLYEFRAAHPEIATKMNEFVPATSPLAGMDAEIRRAEQDLIAARTGKLVDAASRAPRNTAATQKLHELEAELVRLRAKYTESHPEVVRQLRAVEAQKQKVREEQAALDGEVQPGQSPEEARKSRIARAEAHLQELLKRKVDVEKQNIKTPKLQREWAEISLADQTLGSELMANLAKREQLKRDRIIEANKFQENFQLVDAARVPEIPSHPNRNQVMFTGMGVTAIIGLLLAMLREMVRQTFVDATEFEQQTGLQVFAVLPNIQKKEA